MKINNRKELQSIAINHSADIDYRYYDIMIADIMTNRRSQAIIKELFIRCRKLNISLVFIARSYFSVQC